jgi:flagellar assembly factor FliW
MLVKSTRFGPIAVKQEDVLVFPNGLIGFEKNRHWLIVSDAQNTNVAWLQSASEPQVAVPVVSPRKFLPEYRIVINRRQLACLQMRSTDRIFVMCVLSKTNRTLTVNLRGPIIVNLSQHLGAQVILNDSLPLALPLVQAASGELKRAA